MNNTSSSRFFKLQVKTEVIDFELLAEKGKRIVILGHNGKGKTTFSECIRSGNNCEYSPSEIQNTHPNNTYVFNRHFVSDNVFEDTKTKDIQHFILGESLKKAYEEFEKAKKDFQEISTKLKDDEKQIKNKKDELTAKFGDWQKYDKKGKADIENELKELRESLKLTEGVRHEKYTSYEQPQFPYFQGIFQFLEEKVSLGLTEEQQNDLFKFVDAISQNGRSWIKEGLQFTDSDRPCPFCQQNLESQAYNIIEQYKKFFMAEQKGKLSEKIKSYKKQLEDLKKDLEKKKEQYPKESDFFLDNAALDKELETLLHKLDEKENKPSEAINYDLDNLEKKVLKEYKAQLENINVKIEEKNNAIQEKENKQQQALVNKLETEKKIYHLEQFESYKKEIDEIKKLENELKNTSEKKKEAKDKECQAIENFKKETKGLTESFSNSINEEMTSLGFDYFKVRINPVAKNHTGKIKPSEIFMPFKIKRTKNEKPSEIESSKLKYQMSEGERNALGISFFFAQLKKNQIKDSLIIFDDPITSFDIVRERKTLKRIKALDTSNTIIILTHLDSFITNLIQDFDKNSTLVYIINIDKHSLELCENYIPENEDLKTLLFKYKYLTDLEAKIANTRKIIEKILTCTLLIHEKEPENLKKYFWNSKNFTRKISDPNQKENFSKISHLTKQEFDILSKFMHDRNAPYSEEEKVSDLKEAWGIIEKIFAINSLPITGAISKKK